jgi:hypothetical protein
LKSESLPGAARARAENPESGAASITEQLSPAELAEAHRIAGELVRLRRAGAISDPDDPVFFATLLRDFGATFTGMQRGRAEGGGAIK